MPLKGITSFIVAIITVIMFFYLMFSLNLDWSDNQNKIWESTWENTLIIWPVNETWYIEKWWEFYTGITAEEIWKDIEPAPQTDDALYLSYVQNWNSASFVPSSQGKISWGYATKSQLMNDYLAKNTFKFIAPNTIKKWYLYIKLKKPSTDWIFIYWYGSDNNWPKRSWDLKLEKNLLSNNSEEYLFNLSDIPYVRYYDKKDDSYNWLADLQKWKSKFIAWFLRVYDWTNKIDQISIAWE